MRGIQVHASFYRGGTSRGLFFPAAALAPYTPRTRDQIICTAMGSPDPGARQIDGLGGGASSLSKIALISAPGRGLYTSILRELGPEWRLPGVEWADDARRARDAAGGWDVVYRFGQVPVNGDEVDWSATCGNLLAAAGLFALQHRVIHPNAIRTYAAEHVPENTHTFRYPVRVLQANTGQRATVSVPLNARRRAHDVVWELAEEGATRIAGVPGTAPGIEIGVPLPGAPLPTGRVRDTIDLDGGPVDVSIVDAGLPVIFVRAPDLGVDADRLTRASPAELDQDTALHARIEDLRLRAVRLSPALTDALCTAAPKVCLLLPRSDYTTSGGEQVARGDIDVLVRPVSVGQFHRSVPATTLSALAVAQAYQESLVSETLAAGGARASPPSTTERLSEITVGHPAGSASAALRTGANGEPESIVYERTARRIMGGEVYIPPHVATRWDTRYADKFEARKAELGERDMGRAGNAFAMHTSASVAYSPTQTATTTSLSVPRTVTLASWDAASLVRAVAYMLQAWDSALPPSHLLFAVSRDMPGASLAECVAMLHTPGTIAAFSRTGFLSASLPPPATASARGTARMHSVAVSLFPAGSAVPFRSTIRGTARVAVGRSPQKKEVWKPGAQLRADRLDAETDWRALWGRENVAGDVPETLTTLGPEDVDALLFATDAQPQGLLEGLDARFPDACLLGAFAPLTPFQTGRELTLLHGAESALINEDGAVGLALLGARGATATRLVRTYAHLEPIGPRLALTGARGNIISSLDGANAAQQFIRLLAKSPPLAGKTASMRRDEVRTLSSYVDKEAEFVIGVYEDREPDSPPVLIAQINSGHPMRGTVGVNTDKELGSGALDNPAPRWVQIFRPASEGGVEGLPRAAAAPEASYTPLSRFQVLSLPPEGSPADAVPGAWQTLRTWHDVHILRNAFVVGTERGWVARDDGEPLSTACTVPYTSAELVW
ncbi:hypothetical protein MSPP1_002484 [Malassezia sp. CBS 17886]|nr:hypothetical protein MSPP1_002484 [Malassezia sp. CBS 17886]